MISREKKNKLIKKDSKSVDIIKPVLRGRDVSRYSIEYQDLYLINVHNGYKNEHRIDINNYPAVKEHLDVFYDKLEKRYDKGKTPYNLRNCSYLESFTKRKIFYNQIGNDLRFFLDKDNYFCNDKLYFITSDHIDLAYLTAILNSSVLQYYFTLIFNFGGGKGGAAFKNIPILKISKEAQQPFIEKADIMLNLNKQLQQKKTKFTNRLTDNFEIEKLSKKLDKFYNFDFKILVAELKKKKIAISLNEQDEWEEYFTAYKTEINTIQAEISKTDKEIDQMVYELYELTEDEVRVVEGS